MSGQKTGSRSLRVIAGLSAALLTLAAVLYAPIGLGTQSPADMAIRTHLVWAVVLLSAAATWIVAFRPERRVARLAAGVTAGFNGIWIFSFVGLPVVVVSLIAILVSAIGVPRRLVAAMFALAIVGFGLGLLVLRVTEPAGEHIFG